jgi:hypothetical protein
MRVSLTVPSSVVFVSVLEAVATAIVVQWCRSINERHGVVDVVFLTQFVEELVSNSVRSR